MNIAKNFTGAVSGLKNTFSFHLKSSSRSQDILSCVFSHVEKRFDLKDKVNFNMYDVKTWLTSICNTHIDQYLKK